MRGLFTVWFFICRATNVGVMSNAKTVSLIDHEIRQLREAVMIHIERIDLTVAELRAAVDRLTAERLGNQGGVSTS